MRSIQSEPFAWNAPQAFGKQFRVLPHDACADKKLDRPAIIFFRQHHPFMRAQIAGQFLQGPLQNNPPCVLHAHSICGGLDNFRPCE